MVEPKTRQGELERFRKAFLEHTLELFERDEYILPVAIFASWNQDENNGEGGYSFAVALEDPMVEFPRLDGDFINVVKTISRKTKPEMVFVVGEMVGEHYESTEEFEAAQIEREGPGDDASRVVIMQMQTHEKIWVIVMRVVPNGDSEKLIIHMDDREWGEAEKTNLSFIDVESVEGAEN